uniref:Uncharacterized protein n=1 Tax=Cacopsylla melanoneura TaxID=428564 RepID=A0A8D9AC92_9HEMI
MSFIAQSRSVGPFFKRPKFVYFIMFPAVHVDFHRVRNSQSTDEVHAGKAFSLKFEPTHGLTDHINMLTLDCRIRSVNSTDLNKNPFLYCTDLDRRIWDCQTFV